MPIFSTSKLITIDRHIALEQEKYPEATGEFTSLLHDLTFAIRIIAREVRSAGINDILGLTDSTNIHGEKVRKIDEYANEVINRTMDHSGHLCCMISEESEEIIQIPSIFKKGKYILAFDPLDGSSNIDVNGTIGTIFSLYKRISPSNEKLNSEDVLQPGFKQAAAGYVLYGSSTLFVYTTGNGVNVFTYDPSLGEFLLTFENIKMPKYGTYYSCNEGNSLKWEKNIQNYLNYLKTPSKDKKRPFTMRYYATIVADIHRMLHYGGVYLYPAESGRPGGKIRLLYEANPLAMIVEHAGGKAITGKKRILDVQPESIHQTVPVFFGSEENIKELEGFLS
jgi:fructose-1,6-bisphosphatase I